MEWWLLVNGDKWSRVTPAYGSCTGKSENKGYMSERDSFKDYFLSEAGMLPHQENSVQWGSMLSEWFSCLFLFCLDGCSHDSTLCSIACWFLGPSPLIPLISAICRYLNRSNTFTILLNVYLTHWNNRCRLLNVAHLIFREILNPNTEGPDSKP